MNTIREFYFSNSYALRNVLLVTRRLDDNRANWKTIAKQKCSAKALGISDATWLEWR